MVTGFEKQIYNCYLANVRSRNGQPFKLRKKWKGFEDDPNYYYVKKLAYFFRRHDNINIDDSNNFVATNISSEDSAVQAVCNAVWTQAVKDAWKAKLIADKE